MAAIFYHDTEQKALAEESKAKLEKQFGKKIHTAIIPADKFYLAEDYHQKYTLRRDNLLIKEFKQIYPNYVDLTNSTAAAKVNGYLAGYGSNEKLKEEINSLGLSEKAKKHLLEAAR